VLLLSVVIAFLQSQLLLFSTFQSSLIKLLIIRQASSRKNFACTIFAIINSSLEGQIVFQILLSLFGIAVVYRNLSLLEKFEVISKRKMFLCFLIFQFPLFLFVIFKEQIVLTLLFIGIFLTTLIFYRKILKKFADRTYEKCHLHLLDRMILLLKAGKSSSTAIKITLNDLSGWEKTIFAELETVFELQKSEKPNLFMLNTLYFQEIKIILRSNHHIAEQMTSFRDGLKLRHSLRHRSRQVTQQIRAQALVSILIYFVFLFMGFHYFKLEQKTGIISVSALLFLVGLGSIFLLGGRIRWKT
jgi:hypothetical protein